ncbi:Isoniazid-inducible protein iniA [Microbacterium saccharophilum]|uniref:Isoniazid-inducible protein iniA n=1 Tax=Microbacterium saccharophilum TaxID=1213358 RepID=A0A5C8I7S0_9MICO|nr:dynamin family protein [Microbacterium saccharophilum]TXK15461.1 Isoniazid-inducible protein iniA [Microbacterium saccharophilum]GEP47182.1 isoniazid-inducible protein iniA [Microbacterium saccharophilum]
MAEPTTDATTDEASQRETAELVRYSETLAALSRAAGREDLADRLRHTRARLLDPYVRVLVVGEYKQGKSKLINALVGAPACPVDDDVATRVPTVVAYGETPSAALLVRATAGGEVARREVPLDDVAEHITSHPATFDGEEVVGAEVLLPREILKGGLRLVDSPGVGDVESFRALATLSALAGASAMLLVSDASQEYTASELRLMGQALRISPQVSAVLSKTDVYPHWRRIEEIDRGHLSSLGGIPVFAVSSDLRLAAGATNDAGLNDESGFPVLVQHLRREVVAPADDLQRRAAALDLASVVDQLAMAVQSEQHALQHPEQTPELIARLESARQQAEDFRSRSSRWQVILTDGIADLIADTEHDLRDRLRRVQRQAEEAIEEGDPSPIWDEFSQWLDERVGEAVADTFIWTNERQQWLTQEVAAQFLEGEHDIPDIDVSDITGVLDPVDEIAGMDAAPLSAAEKIYIGVRGSYGGVLMVGLATSVLGMAVLNPLSLLAGVLVGRRAYREDKQARLSRRQSEAKNLVRRYIDEVAFQVGKQLRDRLRVVQRATRDHFGARADEIHRSLTAAADAARQAASVYTKDRDVRLEQLRQHAQALTELRKALPAVTSAAGTGDRPSIARRA